MTSRDLDRQELDRIFDVLSNPYRRRILLRLTESHPHDEPEFMPLNLATDDDDLNRLRTILYHNHLPKLNKAGYIEWDRDTMTIRPGPRFEEIAPLIRLINDHQDELPADWP